MNNKKPDLLDDNIVVFEDNDFNELGALQEEISGTTTEFNSIEIPEGFSLPESLTDETISQDQINEMKMLGMPRPPGVTYQRWFELQSERYEHHHIIQMAAGGMPQSKISEITGYSQTHLSKVLNTPWVKVKVEEAAKSIYGTDWKKAIKDLNAKALMVVSDILENGKESERASMAKWNLEHTIGKASQDIQVTKTTLTEFIIKVGEMESNQLRDVGSTPKLLPEKEDPFDTIINEIIPKGMVIGKRSNGEGQSE